jgi:hypothetical protein
MRTPKVLLLGLTLGILTGCGTTVTASPAPSPVRAGASPTATKPAPAARRGTPAPRTACSEPDGPGWH